MAENSKAVLKIDYPDYTPSQDFSLWFSGWREKLCMACNLAPDEEEELQEEIVKFISGKLASGPALTTYNDFPEATKTDYDLLIKALTDEFLDPQEKYRFNENLEYNKREKGQSIKEFMQNIIADQNRYSDIPEFVGSGDNKTKNPTRLKDGIKRFRKGLRDRNGNKDKNQQRHMRYNLHQEQDLTWENALSVARRWEAAHDAICNDDSNNGSGSDVDAANRKKISPNLHW